MSKTRVLAFQVKITLRDSNPAIWRRLLVSSETKLSQLHDIIQIVMGWRDSHLHRFTVGIVSFSARNEPGDLEEMVALDERYAKLSQLILPLQMPSEEPLFRFEYEYDFGDGWIHDVVIEDVVNPDSEHKIPFCIDGAGSCPPEDIGGIEGYSLFLKAIRSLENPEYVHYREGIRPDFDPTAFDVASVNELLAIWKVVGVKWLIYRG